MVQDDSGDSIMGLAVNLKEPVFDDGCGVTGHLNRNRKATVENLFHSCDKFSG
jgi:hypothetical protein